MYDLCLNCHIPLSTSGSIRWCLYCEYALDKASHRLRKLTKKFNGNDKREFCLSYSEMFVVNLRFAGEAGPRRECTKASCCVLFAERIPNGTEFFIDYVI